MNLRSLLLAPYSDQRTCPSNSLSSGTWISIFWSSSSLVANSSTNPARGSWADQQDQPEGLDPNVDLIDLGGDGAAFGAPAEDNPEPVVHGPPNYNIFHGESPPRLIETKQEEIASGVAPSAPEVEPVSVEEGRSHHWSHTGRSNIGDVDYDPDDAEDDPAPTEGAAPSAPSSAPREEGFQQVRRRGTRGGKDEKKKSFKRQFHQVGLPSAHRWLRGLHHTQLWWEFWTGEHLPYRVSRLYSCGSFCRQLWRARR